MIECLVVRPVCQHHTWRRMNNFGLQILHLSLVRQWVWLPHRSTSYAFGVASNSAHQLWTIIPLYWMHYMKHCDASVFFWRDTHNVHFSTSPSPFELETKIQSILSGKASHKYLHQHVISKIRPHQIPKIPMWILRSFTCLFWGESLLPGIWYDCWTLAKNWATLRKRSWKADSRVPLQAALSKGWRERTHFR